MQVWGWVLLVLVVGSVLLFWWRTSAKPILSMFSGALLEVAPGDVRCIDCARLGNDCPIAPLDYRKRTNCAEHRPMPAALRPMPEPSQLSELLHSAAEIPVVEIGAPPVRKLQISACYDCERACCCRSYATSYVRQCPHGVESA